jgi:hypothetical protein
MPNYVISKWQDHKVDHSLATNVKIRNVWRVDFHFPCRLSQFRYIRNLTLPYNCKDRLYSIKWKENFLKCDGKYVEANDHGLV